MYQKFNNYVSYIYEKSHGYNRLDDNIYRNQSLVDSRYGQINETYNSTELFMW